MRNIAYFKIALAMAPALFMSAVTEAKDLPAAFLPHSVVAEPVLIDTQETVVESDGQKYRQIEYAGDKYLVSYVDRDQTHDDEPVCVHEIAEELPKTPETFKVLGQIQPARHRETFVQGLRLRCQKMLAPSPFEAGLKLRPAENTAQAASPRDRQKKDLGHQDEKPIFGNPGTKTTGIPF